LGVFPFVFNKTDPNPGWVKNENDSFPEWNGTDRRVANPKPSLAADLRRKARDQKAEKRLVIIPKSHRVRPESESDSRWIG
jgi:hypothetical protein